MTVEKWIVRMIRECEEELDVDKKFVIFRRINDYLPVHLKLKVPSLVTRDYIDTALGKIEKVILLDQGRNSQQHSHTITPDQSSSRTLLLSESKVDIKPLIAACIIGPNDHDIAIHYNSFQFKLRQLIKDKGYSLVLHSNPSNFFGEFSRLIYRGYGVRVAFIFGISDIKKVNSLCRKIKEISPQTYTIYVAGHYSFDERSAPARIATLYIMKIIKIDDILGSISNVISMLEKSGFADTSIS